MTQGFFPEADFNTDFLIEVSRGNVSGASVRGIVMRNPTTGTSFEDIWGAGGEIVYPTAAETWEILSTSANDTAAGTGARQVLVNYLDDQYIERSTIVALNGTTPVTLNTDHFRPNGAVVIESGSSKFNEGDITIRDAGTTNPRQTILVGFSASEDTHFTVPAGKEILVLNFSSFFTKNNDGVISGRLFPFGTNTRITAGRFPFYQNAFTIDFKALFMIDEKSDFKYQALSSNANQEVNAVVELLYVDK